MNAVLTTVSTSIEAAAPVITASAAQSGAASDGFGKVLLSASTKAAHSAAQPKSQATTQSTTQSATRMQSATATALVTGDAALQSRNMDFATESCLTQLEAPQSKTNKTCMAALGKAATTSEGSTTNTQAANSTKSAQATSTSKVIKSTGPGNTAQTAAAKAVDSSDLATPIVITVPVAPVVTNSMAAESSTDDAAAVNTLMAQSVPSHSVAESAVKGFTTSTPTYGDKGSGTVKVAESVPTKMQGMPSTTEDTDATACVPGALAEAGDTVLKDSAEEAAQRIGLNRALAGTVSQAQAKSADATSYARQAAEHTVQPANWQIHKSETEISAKVKDDGWQNSAPDESVQSAALRGQFAASQANMLEHSADDTTQSSAHKSSHEPQASSGVRAAQAPSEASKTEKLHEPSTDTVYSNATTTTSTTSATATTKIEPATTVGPITAMTTTTAAATSTSGTTPARGTAMAASAETRPATITTSESSTLDAAHLRTTASSTELKVSVQVPELGRVEVRAVSSVNGTLAHVTTEHHDAASVLNDGREGLEAALRMHDVSLGSLSAQTQSQGGQQQGETEAQRSRSTSTSAGDRDVQPAHAVADDEARTVPEYASISVLA